MSEWTPVILGIIVAIILGILLEFILGSWGGIVAYLIATIYVGYSVGGDYINCAIHGSSCRYICINRCRYTRHYRIRSNNRSVGAGAVAIVLIIRHNLRCSCWCYRRSYRGFNKR